MQRTLVGRLALLALALATACGAALISTAAAAGWTAPAQAGAPVRLELTPAAVDIEIGGPPARYTATLDANGRRTDVTQATTLRFKPIGFRPTGQCDQRKLTAFIQGKLTAFIEASCPDPGRYEVTGELDVPRLSSDPPARLRVVTKRVPPQISSVVGNPSPPNRTVEVKGTTGSCNQEGTLTLEGIDAAPVPVVGEFAAKLKIPAGTTPNTYTLLLKVDCDGKLKAGAELRVEKNQPPKPVNDRVAIDATPGVPSTIKVLDNDTDPDDPDGYETHVAVERDPAHGTAVVRPDQAIDYTPDKGFLDAGVDRFTYRSCDVIADGALDCGTATVIVTKFLPEPVADAGITTVQERPVAIEVMRNDRNAGKDDIATLRVLTEPAPQGGRAEPQSDGSILYTPATGFTGPDTFAYDYCGVRINAAAPPPCHPAATVTVTVEPPPVPPRIDTVDRNPSPPNREVVVKGTTGSCDKAATLTLNSAPKPAVPVPLTGGQDGSFEAKLQIPAGTFVGPYKLQLQVVCDGKPQVVEHELKVANQPPNASDDLAAIDATPGVPSTIEVLGNDTDPDDPDGYKTRVAVERDPAHGTAVVRPDQTIGYTPGEEFVDAGEDRFTYRYCDVVGADDQTDCDTATVTVTKLPPEPVDDPGITTVQDHRVTIDVMGNDRNAGKPDIPKLQVKPQPVPQGEPRPQPDGTIQYSPKPGVTGKDTFQYDYCGGPTVATANERCPAATVTVTVEPLPVDPRIDSVDPNPSPSNREVMVKGTTGTCSSTGELRLEETKRSSVTVAGNFTARLPIPPGTFPGDHQLLLSVPCQGSDQQARFKLVVQNQPPKPVNDDATTLPGNPVRIEVTRNDTDPDDPDGYATRVQEATPGPSHGRIEVLDKDQTIVYIPGEGFDRRGDQFAYAYCDVVGPNDQTACGTATVTVARTPPTPVPDAIRTKQDVEVLIPVTDNDKLPDKAALHVSRPPDEPQAKAVVDSDHPGSIRYTPAPGRTGTDTFAYDYCPVGVNAAAPPPCPSATVTVTVEPPPVDPAIDTIAPDPSPPNHEVVVKGTTGNCDKAATLTLNSAPKPAVPVPLTGSQDGSFEAKLKVPPGTFVGSYRLQLQAVCDGQARAIERELKVANQPPEAADDPAPTIMDTPVTIDVTANDPDPDGDDGYRTSLDPGTPDHGAAEEEQPGNRIRYRPEAGFTGEDRFRYRFCDLVDADDTPDCGAATVIVTVDKPPPEAVDDPARTVRDRPVRIEVTGNDKHPDRAKLHVSRPPTPPATAVEQRQPPASIFYTPARGFTGTDTFQYDYCGSSVVVNTAGQAACTPATVTVTVEKPDPVPVDDPDVTTVVDQVVVIDVMGNDRDPDLGRLRLRPQPRASGRPERLPDGRIRYTPDPGFTGTDTFRYDYCGGPVDAAAARGRCRFATVTVTVTATPVISSVRPASSPAGRKVEVTGNTGSCQRAGRLSLQGTGAAVAVSGNRDGGFTASLAVPPGTFPGEYRLELRVICGGQVQRAEATLTVTNRAPEAVDDADTTTRDHSVTIPVTRNDRDPDDPDGHQNLVLVTSQPAHGTAEVQPDQTILYTPASGFVGQDRFGYSLCDDVLNAAGGADCGAATVTVTVTDTPVISSVTPGSTPPGQPVQVVGNTGSCSRAGTLIFHGPVDLPLPVSADENGRFATGFTIPAGTFPQPYQLELRVDCGRQVQQAEATLTVTNQAPEAVDDPATTTPDTPVTIDVTGNDRDPDDPDGYATLVLVSSEPSHGTAEVQPDNRIRYTPAKGFFGQDRFGYSLCDDVLNAAGGADCGNATVTVTVSGTACVPAGGTPRLEIAPGKGPGGTRLRITAAVDRRLAACPLRFFLGGTPLGPDVRVGGDGSLSADREVPKEVKRGRSSLRLATQNAQTLAEQPFEVVGGLIPSPVRLTLGVGALLVGALARLAFRRWRASRDQRPGRRSAELPDDVRAEPHTRPVEVGVEPVPDGTRTFAVRLQPHADPGTQTLQEG